LFDEKDNINPELTGRVCADQITPYPPGIPVLVPGQVITQEITRYLVGMLRSQKRIEMHGIVHDGYLPCIRLLTAAEEKGLKRLV
jgi:arginine decarboxylase